MSEFCISIGGDPALGTVPYEVTVSGPREKRAGLVTNQQLECISAVIHSGLCVVTLKSIFS